MRSLDDLRAQLARHDGRSYGAYKDIRGAWTAPDGTIVAVDHVQGDPFAAPSRLRLCIPAARHGIPEDARSTAVRRIALCDFVLRRFASELRRVGERSGSGHSGELLVDAGGAEILDRSGCGLVGDVLELRLRVGLPARGRRVLGRVAARLLADTLPAAAARVHWEALPREALWAHVHLAEDHAGLQDALRERRLVAFVGDGSILPRESGVSSAPLADAVPFASPPSLRVELPTRHHGTRVGMGIPAGVTLVTGGGFHGKTTLLAAIEDGIYPHVPGDGREWVATVPEAVKVRSEDGRSVVGVDLGPFIRDLPRGRDTAFFTTPDASGSTSLAAAILEALEVGAKALLIDEDTSATNLLIRDARMQELVARETITPLIDRVRELHESLGVSTLLVVGGSGDYLEVADRVLLMEDYVPRDVTERAREVAQGHPTGRRVEDPEHPVRLAARRPRIASLDPRKSRRGKVRAHGRRELRYGDETIDLSALDQLVDDSQARAIGVLLEWLGRNGVQGHDVARLLDDVLEVAAGRGLYDLQPLPELAAVRRFELAAALNRLRGLEIEAPEG